MNRHIGSLRQMHLPVADAPPRPGTSLIEVLMSLLVMGVGVVAVATLFPASVLRSVQATQLTNATILRYNAEAAIDLNPNLIYDPDANYPTVPTGIYDEIDPANPALRARYFMIDPWGRAVNNTSTVGTGAAVPLPRYDGGRGTGTNAEYRARTYVSQPDSWVSESETIDFIPEQTNLSGGRATSVTLRQSDVNERKIDLNTVHDQLRDGIADYRVVLFDADGRLSEVRNYTKSDYVNGTDPIDPNPANPQIKWTGRPLPNDVRYSSISRVRIEKFEPRYSWVMTVRRQALFPPVASGTEVNAEVSVAVLFRRSVSEQDEIAYRANTDSDPSVLTPDTPINTRPEFFIRKFNNDHPNPFIKKGGYLLDLDRAQWYRIASVSGSADSPRIKLDRNYPRGEPIRNVMFYRGVVDVYPFTKKVKTP